MKAIRVTAYGGAEVLEIISATKPTPGPDEALISVKACGVNYIDIYMRSGRYPRELPFTPGFEGAGIVESVGEGVTDVRVGDRVAYTSGIGSYSEYTLVKSAELIPLPTFMTFEQGAAFPLQGMTAHYLLHEFYRIRQGDFVLVHAAAGGMGLLLIQWIKHLGGIVIGTVSSNDKAEIAQLMGADHIIIYTEEDFVAAANRITDNIGVDYIIDGVGKTTFSKNLEAVRKAGHICIFGSASGQADPISPNALQAKSITLSGGNLFNFINSREEILMRANAVIDGIKEGWLKLTIKNIYPLSEVSTAHTQLENRHTIGKIILTTD